MLLAGLEDPKAYELAEKICVEMGQYFQIQDDYLDCYGDPEVIGKIGTDIEDSKCSWLVVNALERASKAQKQASYLDRCLPGNGTLVSISGMTDVNGSDR